MHTFHVILAVIGAVILAAAILFVVVVNRMGDKWEQ